MAVTISSDQLRLVLARAAASPAAEVCGLLLGDGDRIDEARACSNIAVDPARRFEIDPAALVAAYRQARAGGPTILGCYHSHPAGPPEPSPCDAAEAAPNGWLWIIVARGSARAWRADRDGARHGRFDEVTLLV